ncbi:hypothetical protein DPMN_184626 [Dreissena polymorpha]|uniref:Uncharacterized protein n=1 Tax=Dreissena polymorpha TaxID=45954 RepID=A0A9D4DM57_DREPO|nr:hypothetical protein DPMN_184626 [Dreissena polymorpha]
MVIAQPEFTTQDTEAKFVIRPSAIEIYRPIFPPLYNYPSLVRGVQITINLYAVYVQIGIYCIFATLIYAVTGLRKEVT